MNLQVTAKTLKEWRNFLHTPCKIWRFTDVPSALPNRTPTTVARSPAARWGPGRQTNELGVRLDSLGVDWCWRLGRGTTRWWPVARQPRRLHGGGVPGEVCGRAKPYVIVEALVEVWEGDQRLGRAGEQAEGQAHHSGANGNDGRRVAHWRVQGNDPGGGL
jgi:hypothetical protein